MITKSPGKQVLLMVLFQIASAVTPFVVLPAVARSSNPADWSSFVLGQSLGAFAATLVSYGWPLSGITAAARASSHKARVELLTVSLISRVFIVIPTSAVVIFSIFELANPANRLIALSVSLGLMVASGLSFTWFFIGDSRVDLAIIFGVGPLLLSAGATVVAVYFDYSPAVYGCALVVTTVFSLALFMWSNGSGSALMSAGSGLVKKALVGLRSEIAVASSQWASALYMAVPMVIATTVFSTEASAKYASADRSILLGVTALAALGSVLQAWVSGDGRSGRAMSALWLTLATSLAGGAVVIVLGDGLLGMIFGSNYDLGVIERVLIGVFFVFYGLRGSCVRYFLVPNGFFGVASLVSLTGLTVLAVGLGVNYLVAEFGKPLDILAFLALAELAAAFMALLLASLSVREAANRSIG